VERCSSSGCAARRLSGVSPSPPLALVVEPDVLELSALFELVDECDGIDGLTPGIQCERSPVDLAVAFPIEVARVEDLADRPDRAGGEHHRPENRLLGIEVLRGDRGGLRNLGDLGLGHGRIQGVRKGRRKGWKGALAQVAARGPNVLVCRRSERMFVPIVPSGPDVVPRISNSWRARTSCYERDLSQVVHTTVDAPVDE